MKTKITQKNEVKIIEIIVYFKNGDRVETVMQSAKTINKIVKENPVIQRIVDGDLA